MAEFLASQQQISVVESAVEHAYTVVSRNKGLDPIDVAIGGYCTDITDVVLGRLSGTFSVRRRVCHMTADLPYHEFFDVDTDWVGDATWQQFLEPVLYFPLKRLVAENTPRLMLVRRAEVPQFLTRYGIPARRLPIWEHARPE